jgi:hypothetical protein
LADSPITVTGNVTVASGVTLTIEPGVTVKFDSGKALVVEGTLVVRGTSSEKITFTASSETPETDAWGFIKFTDSSVDAVFDGAGDYTGGSVLEHCTVEYGNGIGDGAILAIDASPFINYCTFQNNSLTRTHESEAGQQDHTANTLKFDLAGGTLKITNNTFTNNKVAIDINSSGNEITISGNTFDGNLYEALELSAGNSTVTISNNTIKNGHGTTPGNHALFLGASASGSINITNNHFFDSSGYSTIELGQGTYLITGNLFYGTSRAIDSREGNFIDGGVTISNNSFIDTDSGCNDDAQVSRGAGCGIRMKGPVNPTISNNKFHSINVGSGLANGVAIALWRGGTVTNNTFSGNTGNSLISKYQHWNDSAKPILTNNNFHSNSVSYIVYLPNDTVAGVTATSNWWGTTSDPEVQTLIYDWNDDASLATVDYTPFLTAPDTTAPPSPPQNVAAQTGPTTIAFAWDANPEADIAGYKVHYDTDAAGYPYASSVDVGNLTSYNITGLSTATTYYTAISAYDSDGNESWVSSRCIGHNPQHPTDSRRYVLFRSRSFISRRHTQRIRCGRGFPDIHPRVAAF